MQFEPHEMNLAQLHLANGSAIHRATMLGEVQLPETAPFLAFSIVWSVENWSGSEQLLFHFSGETEKIPPVKIELDEHAAQGQTKFISRLYFAEKSFKKFRIHYAGRHPLQNVEVHFFNPGASEQAMREGLFGENFFKIFPEKTLSPQVNLTCPCPQPDFQNRLDWCPSGNCPKSTSPSFTNVTHLIIHHSAGTNTATDWSAVVRSIWDFHVNVNGWDDIGYNWLVDPNGVLYEGRGDGVLGAHFCGKNGGTMGVCMMGDFTNVSPTPAAVETLTELLAWKACDVGADPLGSAFHASSGLNLNRISGHRDGCATACPGDSFYPMLPDVRASVEVEIDDCQGVPSLVAPTNLNGGALSQTQIQLTWKDNSTNETGFVVERSTNNNSNFFELTELPANTNSYADFTVFADMGYFYRVKAVQGNLSSGYSNEKFISTGSSASDEELSGETVQIFPNPAADEATVFVENQWIGMMQVAVFDGLGRQVKPVFEMEKREAAAEFSLDLREMAAGIFWVKISQEGKVAIVKIARH